MKMCSASVEPMPSRMTVPVFSFQRRKMSAGSASPAETQARTRREIAAASLQRRELRGVERRHAEEERRAERSMISKVVSGVGRGRAAPRCADPEREGHPVAEAVGEEQLGRGEADVVFASRRALDAVELAGHHHVAMAVHGALGPAGRARGIEPEAVVGRRRRGAARASAGRLGHASPRRVDRAAP